MITQERTGNLLDDLEVMTIEELREELKNSIEFSRYVLNEDLDEKMDLRQQIKLYEAAMKNTLPIVQNAVTDIAFVSREYRRWKYTSYALAVICLVLCFFIYSGGAR